MHPHEIARARREAARIEAENLAFRLGYLTATFEHIIQQAEELKMRRELAWARACGVEPAATARGQKAGTGR